MSPISYQDAGVDLAGAERHVSTIAPVVRATWSDAVIGGFGGFAAGIEMPSGYRNPVLMMATDGVGTKLDLARRSKIWSGVGFDLVAMCVDDLTAVGAEPLGFVDYMAVGKLDPERDSSIVASIADACTESGCALLGGETAEHPGVMDPDAVDLAGAVMGVVEKGEEFGPHRVEAGDVIIGLRSPNLRSNGYSLIRRLFPEPDRDESLLAGSVIYSKSVLAVAHLVKSAAHITGGGLPGNLPRAIPPELGVQLERDSWRPPDIFAEVASRGVASAEMFNTFNMGIGFCVIVAPENVGDTVAGLSQHQARPIGIVTETPGFSII
ncbi:MAG TPA: phosphoribosylformylglycinamidine cyclo-ligase [Acidimicrobiia bacterium]